MIATRFRPERAGILNLWHFRRLDLPFADGRLVLRGPTGSGKTKALELLFPLLLDGSIDPRRLDPFGTDGRRMRDNVLAAAEASGHRGAVGYAWITFARTSESGAPERITVGIGVSASQDRDRSDHWTFVTDRVPDVEFRLVDDEHRPLARASLKEELGADRVFDTVEAHRRAVDARLFGLGDERFLRMIELVLQLRKPKLAALLDPERISLLLSESLPPIEGEALNDVARGLAELERIAEEIDAMDRTIRSLRDLHRDHAIYLRAHARKRLDALQEAQRHANDLALKLDENARQRAGAERTATDEEVAERAQREEVAAAEGEIGGLEQSEAYQAGRALDDRRQAVTNLEQAATQAAKREQDAIATANAARKRLAEARVDRDQNESAIAICVEQLRSAAPSAVGMLDGDLNAAAAEVRILLTAAIAARRSAIEEVRAAIASWGTACIRVEEAEKTVARAAQGESEARNEHQSAVERVAEARRNACEAVRGWSEQHRVVTPEDLDAVLVRVADGDREEVTSVPGLVRDRWKPREHELVAREQHAEAAVTEQRGHLDELRAQRERIAAAEEEAPPDSPWRTASRDGRAGAPLWRLTDFAPHLEAGERTGLEGALLAAGILDAWVDPPGVVGHVAIDDAFLVPAEGQAGPTLADVLVPETADDGMRSHVLSILRSIALGRLDQVTVGVDAQGRFRVGPLVGGYRSDRARYVGATAREAERARRLAEIDVAIADADVELQQRSSALRGIQADRTTLEAAVRALPDVGPLTGALDHERMRRQRLDDCVDARRAAETTLASHKREQTEADARRRRTAADRGLPDDQTGLEAAVRALAQFESNGVGHVHRLEQRPRTIARFTEATEHAAGADAAAAEARATHAEISDRLTRERAELEAIAQSLGLAYREILERIAQARERAAQSRRRADEHHANAEAARRDMSRLDGERPPLESLRADADQKRSAAAVDVDAMLQPAFALVLDLGDAPDVSRLEKACADASATEQRLKSVETALQNRFEALQKEAGARLRATLTLQHGLHLVEVEEDSREPSAVYAERLARRLDEQRVLLADRERAIFEDHLLGTLCTALYQRLRAARAFAREADEELRRRPLSSGVRFGLQWKHRLDVAPHEAALLEVVRREGVHLGPEDLDLVRRALRNALAHLRTEMRGADHRALLDRALDYRRWHRFVISVHRAADQPAHELTKHRHAQLSGGEKAAALYAPLFAAARATFAGSYATAPRLVALDEAFEGIDANGRPELLAMTVAFDLDLLLTGYDLWLAEASVPAAMHAQLHHDPGVHLAIAELVKWDGKVLEDVDAPIAVQEAV